MDNDNNFRRPIDQVSSNDHQIFQDILDGLPNLFYLVDVLGKFSHWNQKSIEVTGYSEAEHKEINVLDLFYENDKERVAARMLEVFDKGESNVEAELITKDGRRIPYFFTGKRIVVNSKIYLSGLGTDISERKMLEKKLEYLATTDPLTGVYNRRQFFVSAKHEIARANRLKSKISLLMLDLDNFKSINDGYGHHTGDLVLQELPIICRKVLRDIDIICRMGGEEFAILLTDSGCDVAFLVAERLRKMIAEKMIRLDDGQLLNFTSSIGIATLPGESCNLDMLILIADEALYKAKHGGRNRVVHGNNIDD